MSESARALALPITGLGGDEVVADIAMRSAASTQNDHDENARVALQNLRRLLPEPWIQPGAIRAQRECRRSIRKRTHGVDLRSDADECRHRAGHSCRGGDPMRNNKRLAAAAACLFLALAGCGGSGHSGGDRRAEVTADRRSAERLRDVTVIITARDAFGSPVSGAGIALLLTLARVIWSSVRSPMPSVEQRSWVASTTCMQPF